MGNMKKSSVIWLALVVSFLKTVAQNNLPPVYEIKTDTAAYIAFDDSSWQMLGDKTGKLTIDQVSQSPVADQFHNNTGTDHSVNIYWFRYRIKNVMRHEARITISEDGIPEADIYT